MGSCRSSGSLERSHKLYEKSSGTAVVITVEKIGLKDAKAYKQPRIVVSLVGTLLPLAVLPLLEKDESVGIRATGWIDAAVQVC